MVEEVLLQVVSSPIKFGGRARVNDKTLDEANIKEETLVVVSSEKKDVLVTIYSDMLIEEGLIKLRGEDMRKLGVKDDAKVTMKEHSSLLKKQTLG